MLRPATAILALCFCVVLTDTSACANTPGDSTPDHAKETIKLPAFHEQTVRIDGKDLPIEVRWFDKPIVVGSTDVDTVSASAVKTWVVCFQAVLDEDYETFVNSCVDAKRANNYAEAFKKMPDKQRTPLVKSLRRTKSLGEVRVGRYDLVVLEHRLRVEHQDAQSVTHEPAFIRHREDEYRVDLDVSDQREDMKRALAVGKLIQQDKLGPPSDDKDND